MIQGLLEFAVRRLASEITQKIKKFFAAKKSFFLKLFCLPFCHFLHLTKNLIKTVFKWKRQELDATIEMVVCTP
jgi:hypothetical protein